jgi:hypothetical protein
MAPKKDFLSKKSFVYEGIQETMTCLIKARVINFSATSAAALIEHQVT